MKTSFAEEFAYAAKQGPRLFFAPLVGAIHAIRSEMRRIERENAARQAMQKAEARKHPCRS